MGGHLPRPSFSLSAKSLRPPRLNVGRLVDIFLACLEKKPLFLVEKDGYPFISSLRAFADAQVTFSPFALAEPFICRSPYVFLGLDLPLTFSYGLVKPGLAQPPPLLGDGERDSDIVPCSGVAGMGGSDWGPPAGRPDEDPVRWTDGRRL